MQKRDMWCMIRAKRVPGQLTLINKSALLDEFDLVALSKSVITFSPAASRAVPSSRPAFAPGRRAQGPSRLAVALGSPLAQHFQAPLDGPEHGATLK